jgi:hypothetical protein
MVKPMANRFHYIVTIQAESQEQADKVIGARLGYDEDLSEDGVEDYVIEDYLPLAEELKPF